MKVLFRVEANSHIGLGHLMRCMALAQCLTKVNVDVCFLLSSTTADICRLRHDWIGEIKTLPQNYSEEQEISYLNELVQQQDISFCVLDGYQFSLNYRKALSTIECLHVCFDDLNDLSNLPCDMVINGATNAATLGYEQTTKNATLCLGDDYRVIRQEFVDLPQVALSERRSMTIVMGGSDPLNYTIPIIEKLAEQKFTGQVRVLTGAAYPNLDELKAVCSSTDIAIQHIHNCQQMAEVFCHAKLTISAAGSSQFELAACGSPSILLVLANNQIKATAAAAEQGWCEIFDTRGALPVDAIVERAIALWKDEPLLEKMSDLALQHSDTQGSERIVEAMRALYMERSS